MNKIYSIVKFYFCKIMTIETMAQLAYAIDEALDHLTETIHYSTLYLKRVFSFLKVFFFLNRKCFSL